MGFLDRFKKQQPQNEEKTNIPHNTPNESTKTEFDTHSYIRKKMGELDNSESAKSINASVRDEATRLMDDFEREKKEKEFAEKYKKLIDFKKEFDHINGLKEMGLSYTLPKSESMKKFEALCSKGVMPQRNIDKMFLPYYIERKSLGIITKPEQAELDKILGTSKGFKDLLNATTQESYTQDYNRSLIMLGIIGTLDINEQGEIQGFEFGKALRDAGYELDDMLCGNMYSIGKKAGIAVEGIPQNIKDFMDTIDNSNQKEDLSQSTDIER